MPLIKKVHKPLAVNPLAKPGPLATSPGPQPTQNLPTANIREHQPPDTVIRAMRRKHGKDADKYIQQLRWDAMNKCWFYELRGMLLEVEEDGYIHS